MKKSTTANKKAMYAKLRTHSNTSKTGSRDGFMVSLKEIVGLDIIDLVRKCLVEKKVVSFKVARRVALADKEVAHQFNEKRFDNFSDPNTLISHFVEIGNDLDIQGCDALLVNEQAGHNKKVAARHRATLLALGGFEPLYEYRAQVLKDMLASMQEGVAVKA